MALDDVGGSFAIDENDFRYLGIMDMSRISSRLEGIESDLEIIAENKVSDDLKRLVDALIGISPMGISLKGLREANQDINEQMKLIRERLDSFPKNILNKDAFREIYREVDEKQAVISKYLNGSEDGAVGGRLSSHMNTLSLCRTSCELFENHANNETLVFERMISLVDEVAVNYIPLWRLMALSSSSLSKTPINIEGYEKYSLELSNAIA